MAETILEKVKTSLRISMNTFDDELTDLIEAAKLDLGIAGVRNADLEKGVTPTDALIIRAIVIYCKLYFGEPSTSDHWKSIKEAYDEQKAQLSMATGYTDWGDSA
jgi:uncharacterized phage protein (predicted DNA packaging)